MWKVNPVIKKQSGIKSELSFPIKSQTVNEI